MIARYSRPAMAAVWDDRARFARFAQRDELPADRFFRGDALDNIALDGNEMFGIDR